MPRKNGPGRPAHFEDPEVRAKFEVAASMDMNISACCQYAGISRDVYYHYLQKHPEYVNRYKALRTIPYQKAKDTIVANLGDPKTARWYLETRASREHSRHTRQELKQVDQFENWTDEELEEFVNGKKEETEQGKN